jgi:pyrroloquinoline quinone biosynthesis protein B
MLRYRFYSVILTMRFLLLNPLLAASWSLVFVLLQPSAFRSLVSSEHPSPLPDSTCLLVILGTAQDGGAPHPGCGRSCCAAKFAGMEGSHAVVSLGLVDRGTQKKFLVEATPDLPWQLRQLRNCLSTDSGDAPDGILLTHAHIGHYTGLVYLGKEAMDAHEIRVFAMPRMRNFLENNGPWDQLVTRNNIVLEPIENERTFVLSPNLRASPFLVPHRDEYSETVGFMIYGPHKTALFIPDIDKWERWSRRLETLLDSVDYAFVDGTFFDGEELPSRDMSQIPHPSVTETMDRLDALPEATRRKVYFIHLNHTNPLLDPTSPSSLLTLRKGYRVARPGDVFSL